MYDVETCLIILIGGYIFGELFRGRGKKGIFIHYLFN